MHPPKRSVARCLTALCLLAASAAGEVLARKPIPGAGGFVDVEITKRADSTSALPGDTLRYDINVSNGTATVATNVTVTETVPDGTIFDAAASSSGWSCAQNAPAGTSCSLAVGNLGGFVRVGFAVRVLDVLPAGVETIVNTAIAADDGASGPDANPVNNTATVSTPVLAAPDLTLTMDEIGTTVAAGGTIEYVLSFANDGTQDASGVRVITSVPDQTRFGAAASSPGWSCADGAMAGTPCILELGQVAGGGGIGAQAIFAVELIDPVPAGVSAIEASASIEDDGLSGPDLNPANNQASDMTPFEESSLAPDLVIAKDEEGTTAAPGSTIAYQLAYRNDGRRGATGVEIEEQVPLDTSFDAQGSSAGWSCQDGAPAGTVCSLSIGSLAGGGGSGMAVFTVTVDPFLPAFIETIRNTASIGDDGTNGDDLDPTSNIATDVTPLTDASPDLIITKDDVGNTAAAGDTIVYSLFARNDGTQAATGVRIFETVPLNTRFTAADSSPGWTCGDGALAGTRCAFDLGSLAGGGGQGAGVFAVTIDAVLPAGVDAIENTAEIADDAANGPDLNPSNNQSTDITPLSPETAPDLVIRKDDVGTSAGPGTTVVYDLAIHNDGTQDATGVVIDEVVPEHAVFDALASDAAWSCADGAPAGTPCQLAVGFVPGGGGGGVAVFAVRVDSVLPAGIEEIVNTASITDDGENGLDLNPSNNVSTDMTPLTSGAAPDLVILKDDVGTSAAPGSSIEYRLAYMNDGPQAATGVTLHETVPVHTVFEASASTPGWTCSDASPPGTPCSLTIGSLAGGGQMDEAIFAVTVDSTLPAGVDVITNSASIDNDGANGPDLNLSNNQATDTTPLSSDAAPDLVIVKDDDALTADPGSTVVYSLDYTNDGAQAATGVEIREEVPASTTFAAASSSAGWSCADGAAAGTECSLEIGSLAGGGGGGVAVFAVRVDNILPAAVEEIVNTAVITDDAQNGLDLNPKNNRTTDTTSLSAAAAPDLALTKSDGGVTARPGEVLRYTLEVSNLGVQTATGVIVEEIVPEGATFERSESSDGWSCADGAAAGAACTFQGGSLDPGKALSVTFAVRVDPGLPPGLETLMNLAATQDDGSNGADLNAENNVAVLITPIDRSRDGDLSLEKTDHDASIAVGEVVTYTLTATNHGAIPLQEVTIDELVPRHASFRGDVSTPGWTCPTGSVGQSACFLDLGILQPGASREVTFAVQLRSPPPAGTTELLNEAKIFYAQASTLDPDLANNRAFDTTPIRRGEGIDVKVEVTSRSFSPGRSLIEAEVSLAELAPAGGGEGRGRRKFKVDRDEQRALAPGKPHRIRITAEVSVPGQHLRLPGWVCMKSRCEREVTLRNGEVEHVVLTLEARRGGGVVAWSIEAWPIDAVDPNPDNNAVGSTQAKP